ncbi:MAG: right-handed parallel beta-helix repeat-containing protein, partial [Anaeroplasmataceae bacterium]|nr:right-handed parallel beta-helix repeat-containing protein [Anaeroplasmataceae bacterium]
MEYNVLDFGAKGDGKTLDTVAFRKAITACSATGGKVLVTQGCYLLESIEIKSNVELYLEEGAKLLYYFKKSSEEENSLVKTPTFDACDYDGKPKNYFIYAYQSKNISITGKGIIDGNEEVFYGTVTKWHIDGYFYPRVPMIYFEDCRNVKIEDITLTRSAFWTTHLVGCQDVVIDSITIFNNLRLANCDGIDPDHCKNVVIRNCNISCADDCIVFKNTAQGKKYGDLKNIIVENCTLISTSAAIKFGTESVSDMHDIKISNCIIKNSNRGICLQLRDEGSIYKVSFENIKIDTRRFSPIYWWGKAEPVIVTAVKRTSTAKLGKIY